MPISKEQILSALQSVEDPELHRSIVELEMVRGVTIEGADVSVLIALTVAGCPLKAEITNRVVAALSPLDGVDRVKVDMTVMSPEELAKVKEKMSSSGNGHKHSDAHGHAHNSDRTIPFGKAGSNTRVIGISSGKGGVGKSSITVNTAVALAKSGHSVAILDADVYGFSIPGMLGAFDDPYTEEDVIIPPTAHGVKCISMGFFLDDDRPVMWRGPMLHKALEQFLVDIKWGDLDFLLIDMPPGTGDVAMSMAQYLPSAEIYVVTTPQLAAQRVAQRSGAMAREMGMSVAGVIENMSWFTGDDGKRYELFGRGGGEYLSQKLDAPLVAQIPLVAELRRGSDIGEPITVAQPDSEVAFAFDELARQIAKSTRRRIYREELKVQ